MGKEKNDKKQLGSFPEERNAGILLHITSLPSPFGTGDLGPEARSFADFLHRSRQSYWQVLPLNPTEADQGFSPYSATSSMAGNTLLISPEILVSDELLTTGQIAKFKEPVRSKADFNKAGIIREKFFDAAYINFLNKETSSQHQKFAKFCTEEAYWLNDYVLYVLLKKENKGSPWYQWPEHLKLRNEEVLNEFQRVHQEAIKKEKWLQFVFFVQWKDLKNYCNKIGVHLFGDLPFYVSYDSADVWSHQEIFKLDKNGEMNGIAGVPPDYFNENGQLWGMPVFRWDQLKKSNYGWWAQRIQKNMELYDLIRLDHFRAFSSYWEVPAGESTAKKGKWKNGPGLGFFQTIQKKHEKLPFVAEDLGDIDDAVYRLRDELALPGMKVLQFAFDGDMPKSEHIPHNYGKHFIVYSGTHDNNTTRGWFENDLSADGLKNLRSYIGKHVKERNIHRELSKAAYASVAKSVILPMQDLLGKGKKARMNTPATTENNWLWRLKSNPVSGKIEKRLKQWVKMYNRFR